jgi:hypothetical protein
MLIEVFSWIAASLSDAIAAGSPYGPGIVRFPVRLALRRSVCSRTMFGQTKVSELIGVNLRVGKLCGNLQMKCRAVCALHTGRFGAPAG